jgi:hypothetical protein
MGDGETITASKAISLQMLRTRSVRFIDDLEISFWRKSGHCGITMEEGRIVSGFNLIVAFPPSSAMGFDTTNSHMLELAFCFSDNLVDSRVIMHSMERCALPYCYMCLLHYSYRALVRSLAVFHARTLPL